MRAPRGGGGFRGGRGGGGGFRGGRGGFDRGGRSGGRGFGGGFRDEGPPDQVVGKSLSLSRSNSLSARVSVTIKIDDSLVQRCRHFFTRARETRWRS